MADNIGVTEEDKIYELQKHFSTEEVITNQRTVDLVGKVFDVLHSVEEAFEKMVDNAPDGGDSVFEELYAIKHPINPKYDLSVLMTGSAQDMHALIQAFGESSHTPEDHKERLVIRELDRIVKENEKDILPFLEEKLGKEHLLTTSTQEMLDGLKEIQQERAVVKRM